MFRPCVTIPRGGQWLMSSLFLFLLINFMATSPPGSSSTSSSGGQSNGEFLVKRSSVLGKELKKYAKERPGLDPRCHLLSKKKDTRCHLL